MFNQVYQTRRGDTVGVQNPRLEAHKQIWYIAQVLGRGYRLECHEDGSFTVFGDGLSPMTYEKEGVYV